MPSLAAHLAALAATPLVLASCMSTDSCVAAGTRVATPHGWIPVEHLQPGDAVLAVDVAAGRLVATTLTAVRRARRECLALACDGRTLRVTPDHPIYAPEARGFVDAGRAALGQVARVLLVDHPDLEATPRAVALDSSTLYAGVHDVFDLSVAGDHRTFVAEGFVVHNKSYEPQTTTTLPPAETGETTGPTTGTTAEPDTTSSSTTGTTAADTTAPTEPGTTTGTTADTGGGTFACGEDLQCELGVQYCEVASGGARPTIDYSCPAIPDACAATPDCDCILAEIGVGDCTGTPDTGITVSIAFP